MSELPTRKPPRRAEHTVIGQTVEGEEVVLPALVGGPGHTSKDPLPNTPDWVGIVHGGLRAAAALLQAAQDNPMALGEGDVATAMAEHAIWQQVKDQQLPLDRVKRQQGRLVLIPSPTDVPNPPVPRSTPSDKPDHTGPIDPSIPTRPDDGPDLSEPLSALPDTPNPAKTTDSPARAFPLPNLSDTPNRPPPFDKPLQPNPNAGPSMDLTHIRTLLEVLDALHAQGASPPAKALLIEQLHTAIDKL